MDATQELIVLGCCNILGSFFRSMPVTGSFTRTAVNEASGVRTPFGGIATGIVVMLSLGFLTNTFQYIPKATLAAVIIAAMINMVDFGAIGTIWRARRKCRDRAIRMICFSSTIDRFLIEHQVLI